MLLSPASFDIRGEVLLVPDLSGRVSLLNHRNEVILHLGDDKEWRGEGRKTRHPRRSEEVAAGPFRSSARRLFRRRGNIFVVEWVPAGRVTLLKKVT